MNFLLKILFLTICIIFLLLACSQTRKQEVLSFFFDGVNSQDTTGAAAPLNPTKTDSISGRKSQAQPVFYYHAIYEEKQCEVCHDSENANRLVEELPDLCYQCHSDFSEEYENLHVPAAMGDCGECHHPHMAKHKKLLIAEVQTLCYSCHDQDDMLASETHSDIGETSCTDCHNPHGSNNEYLFY